MHILNLVRVWGANQGVVNNTNKQVKRVRSWDLFSIEI